MVFVVLYMAAGSAASSIHLFFGVVVCGGRGEQNWKKQDCANEGLFDAW